jgi:hypothetical protein
MTFLPIAERELRIRARRPATFALRCVAAALALALGGFILTVSATSRGGTGSAAFRFLIVLAFLYCLYEGLRNTADCLSEEKRAGTLGFLFLTDLKGYDVVIGKLLATSLSSFYALLAILPAIGMPLLGGGVTPGEFWRAVLVLIVTLFFSLSTGMMVSAASRDERRAWAVSLTIIVLAAVVPPALRSIPFVPFHALSWTSPTVAFSTIDESSYNLRPGTFWGAIAGVHLLSWAFLAAASLILPRSWQQRERVRTRRLIARLPDAKRTLLLEQNPVAWLASRDDRIKVFLWAVVAVFGLLFLAACVSSGFSVPVMAAFAAVMLGLHLLITARVAFYVCHAMVEARDEGLLQLLLSTPMRSGQILDGYRAAFKRVFSGPVVLLLWVEGVVVVLSFLVAPRDSQAGPAIMMLVVAVLGTAFVMDLHAVATYGMWVSLTAKKSSQAFNKTMLMGLVGPIVVSAFCCQLAYPFKYLILFSYKTPLYRDFRRLIAEREAGGVAVPK